MYIYTYTHIYKYLYNILYYVRKAPVDATCLRSVIRGEGGPETAVAFFHFFFTYLLGFEGIYKKWASR